MALKIFEKFSPRANPADADYPYGSIKNESVPGAQDGTPLDASWGNDMLGFTDALLDDAGITPNGSPDTVQSSQRLDALKTVARKPLELKIFQSPTDNLTKVTTFAGGVGVVYEVRKTSDNSLATIYSDKDGVTSIPQNGTANVSNGDAEAVFYIANGDYTVTINAVSVGFAVTPRASTLRLEATLSEVGGGAFDVGSKLFLTDRGGALFDVVSGGTPNGTSVLDAGAGNTAIPVYDSVANFIHNGADPSGLIESYAPIQSIVNGNKTPVSVDGEFKLSSEVVFQKPNKFKGNAANTKFVFSDGFASTCFRVSPTVGTDPKNWEIGGFSVSTPSTAGNIFLVDIAATGKYVSKFTIENVISNNQTQGNFVELLNSNPNADGLFTSVVKDNWSFGGYYLSNIGDSMYFLRNTTTGGGFGYYVNQLETAANVTIRDGNCTVSGNALYSDKAFNLTFDNMQVECPLTFTGLGDACVFLDHIGGGLVSNVKIVNCNINTQNNPKYCVRVNETDLVVIDGNDMYCNPNDGAHVLIDADARNTIVGNNKYYSSLTGEEIDPIVIDNGVGTVGVWKDTAPSLTDWASIGTPSEHGLGFYKSNDGTVSFRGRISGTATNSGDTLFTLPLGFRPKEKTYVLSAFGTPATNVIQIIPTGEVQSLTAGTTSIYLNGLEFSTK